LRGFPLVRFPEFSADPASRIGGAAMPENMAALAGLRPARRITQALLGTK